MTFKIEELEMFNESKEELVRTRETFELLKYNVIHGLTLSEFEKEFFCKGVDFSKIEDGHINEYPCCDNFKFKMLYLTYYRDFTGSGNYKKVKGNGLYIPDIREIELDIR